MVFSHEITNLPTVAFYGHKVLLICNNMTKLKGICLIGVVSVMLHHLMYSFNLFDRFQYVRLLDT